jgi:hypothetical protein
MPNVADYSIVSDGDTVVTAGSSKDITFNLSGPDVGSRSILFFNVQVKNPNQEVTFTLNGSVQNTYSFGSEVERAIHEVVPPNLLKAANNKLTISSPASGNGTAHITDIVLMYQHGV